MLIMQTEEPSSRALFLLDPVAPVEVDPVLFPEPFPEPPVGPDGRVPGVPPAEEKTEQDTLTGCPVICEQVFPLTLNEFEIKVPASSFEVDVHLEQAASSQTVKE